MGEFIGYSLWSAIFACDLVHSLCLSLVKSGCSLFCLLARLFSVEGGTTLLQLSSSSCLWLGATDLFFYFSNCCELGCFFFFAPLSGGGDQMGAVKRGRKKDTIEAAIAVGDGVSYSSPPGCFRSFTHNLALLRTFDGEVCRHRLARDNKPAELGL